MPFFINFGNRAGLVNTSTIRLKRIPTAYDNRCVFEKYFVLYGEMNSYFISAYNCICIHISKSTNLVWVIIHKMSNVSFLTVKNKLEVVSLTLCYEQFYSMRELMATLCTHSGFWFNWKFPCCKMERHSTSIEEAVDNPIMMVICSD